MPVLICWLSALSQFEYFSVALTSSLLSHYFYCPPLMEKWPLEKSTNGPVWPPSRQSRLKRCILMSLLSGLKCHSTWGDSQGGPLITCRVIYGVIQFYAYIPLALAPVAPICLWLCFIKGSFTLWGIVQLYTQFIRRRFWGCILQTDYGAEAKQQTED